MDIDIEEPVVKQEETVEEAIKGLMSRSIVLYNDDVNSFEHVIGCLVAYCKHNILQAEQCALIVHNNGKCVVKQGSYKDLKPICEALQEQRLTAQIE